MFHKTIIEEAGNTLFFVKPSLTVSDRLLIGDLCVNFTLICLAISCFQLL